MREIDFRAWDKKLKIMAGVDTIGINFGTGYSCYDLEPDVEDLKKSDVEGLGLHVGGNDSRFILMQYTGLEDKNENMIFEGDILKWNDTVVVVRYDLGFAGFSIGASFGGRPLSDKNNIEIIGNIYEHKHLIDNIFVR